MEQSGHFSDYVPMPVPTSDQLRDNIDKGRTGEKVSMPDPAAAPLGTDAEASGAAPTLQERKLEAENAQPGPMGQGRASSGNMIYIALVACLAVALVVIVALAAT